MSENTKIEWCDHTFNSWEGCQKVGPGCDNCYAEARNVRFGGGKSVNFGPGAPRRRTSAANWAKPLQWNRRQFWQCGCCGWRGIEADMTAQDDGFGAWVACPHCHAGAFSSARQRVFCASLADVFDNAVEPQWRADLFDLILRTPNLDWLLLTKRIGNVRNMLPPTVNSFADVFPNVWLGATIVNQEEADRDIIKLLAVPAAKRFLSMEPLLGPVDLNFAFGIPSGAGNGSCPMHLASIASEGLLPKGQHHLHWVIVGGESGPHARPMHPDWARGLRDQCEAAGVPFLFKQWGEWLPWGCFTPDLKARVTEDYDPFRNACWVESQWEDHDGPVMACDGDPENSVARVGKKAAGRLLDDIEHNGFPE